MIVYEPDGPIVLGLFPFRPRYSKVVLRHREEVMKRSEWKQLRRKLEDLGCTFKMGGAGHWKIYDQNNRFITVMPNTTSDWRAIRNKTAELKRLGIALT